MEIDYCEECDQMTNHLGGDCLKCAAMVEESIASAELSE